MQAIMFISLLSLLLLVGSCLADCGGFPKPKKDPCQPGGVWDPLLKRCTGIDSEPCYQCYSGKWCQTQEDPLKCQLSSMAGNPVYLSEYWTSGQSTVGEPCTRIPQHYRPAYQYNMGTDHPGENVFPLLREAIIELHEMTGNVETTGYTMVSGMGGTMVLHAAVGAIAQRILENCKNSRICPDKVDLFAQIPYYNGYVDLAPNIPGVRWNGSADPNSPFTIEILTYPNNPSGEKRGPKVQDPSRVVMDMVYYWPMYTEVDAKLSHPLMVFSSSKHGGLAGTRFGWSLVQDKDIATRMLNIMHGIMLSYSIDVQLRVLSGLQVMLEEAKTIRGRGAIIPFHDFGAKVMSERFSQLHDALNTTAKMLLINPKVSHGGYAWIVCSNELGPCDSVLETVNLHGIKGSVFGAKDSYVRLSMLLPEVEFNTMYIKLKALAAKLG